MIRRILGFTILLILLSAPSAAGLGGHYLPHAGDYFDYYETIVLNGGQGNYSGYTENTFVNGSIDVTGVAANGTESASYQNSYSWRNNQGQGYPGSSSGNFTFSASSFHYVHGTDNQTGYTNPYVWFYMNNSLPAGAPFYVLNTPFNVVSTNYSYDLGGSRYVATISTHGTGTYQRNDVYGVFTASYTWDSYFDPRTGYIVGYK